MWRAKPVQTGVATADLQAPPDVPALDARSALSPRWRKTWRAVRWTAEGDPIALDRRFGAGPARPAINGNLGCMKKAPDHPVGVRREIPAALCSSALDNDLRHRIPERPRFDPPPF